MEILNVPTRGYTFNGVRGESDIDVSLYRSKRCNIKWDLKDSWEISDHNPIVITIKDTAQEFLQNVWMKKLIAKGCNWQLYRGLVEVFSQDYGLEEYLKLTAEEKLSMLSK